MHIIANMKKIKMKKKSSRKAEKNKNLVCRIKGIEAQKTSHQENILARIKWNKILKLSRKEKNTT